MPSVAAIFPNTEFGRVQRAAFRPRRHEPGPRPSAPRSNFSSRSRGPHGRRPARAPHAVRARSTRCSSPTAPLRRALAPCSRKPACAPGKVQLVGSADWNNDQHHRQHALSLRGALYPATDRRRGFKTLSAEYQADVRPPAARASATIAYTA